MSSFDKSIDLLPRVEIDKFVVLFIAHPIHETFLKLFVIKRKVAGDEIGHQSLGIRVPFEGILQDGTGVKIGIPLLAL